MEQSFSRRREAWIEMSQVRVLVVEDFLPFRRFVCSALQKRSDLQVICEASDGMEALQKFEELRPELVILDIGLPTLNGIEVARRILRVFPRSKIIFLSQESSPDVVQSALDAGAMGYVVKTRAASDLMAAVDAVISEQQFVRST
jgi:two-component system nitrate/nitrite response regulator NarL